MLVGRRLGIIVVGENLESCPKSSVSAALQLVKKSKLTVHLKACYASDGKVMTPQSSQKLVGGMARSDSLGVENMENMTKG